MDKQISELEESLSETQAASMRILREVNRLTEPSTTACQCSCKEHIGDWLTQLTNLNAELEKLEIHANEQAETETELQIQLDKIQQHMKTLESSNSIVRSDYSETNENIEEGPQDYHENVSSTRRDHQQNVNGTNTSNPDAHEEIDNPSSHTTDVNVTPVPRTEDTTREHATYTTTAPSPEHNVFSTNKLVRSKPGDLKGIHAPKVVHQDSSHYMHRGEKGWRSLAQCIMEIEAQAFRENKLNGVYSVICLDISTSMGEGDAWPQACTFINDFLGGLEEVRRRHGHKGLTEEYVSLATFGHDTKLQITNTKQFEDIRSIIESLSLGGPSPMNGGMFLALAAALAPRDNRVTHINNMAICPRIILISDGFLTEIALQAGPDVPNETEMDATRSSFIGQLQGYFARQIQVLCVPVGNSDNVFFRLLEDTAQVKLRNFRQGKRVARRHFLCWSLGNGDVSSFLPDESLHRLEEDKEDLEEIQNDTKVQMVRELSMEKLMDVLKDEYKESKSGNLPPIGSRVRRGPEWQHADQDCSGPGTVTGHVDMPNGLWVEWDHMSGTRHVYRYGCGHYDVLVVDEPRKLALGQTIAVGCKVRPVKHGGNKRRNTCDTGVVIKLQEASNKAQVRWVNGKRGDYIYRGDGKVEIEFCPLERDITTSSFSNPPAAFQVERPKKKNKNV